MARNLREKISAVVNDAYDLRKESVITRIENLIKDELALQQEDRTISYYDLYDIQSSAIKNFVDMNMTEESLGKLAGDQPMIRTLCLVNSVVGLFRSKGFLNAVIKYEK